MVVIIVQGGDGSFQEVFLAAVIVFEANQGVIVPKQLLQLILCTAGANMGIGAVLGIAAAIGMVNRQRKRTAVCFIFHLFHRLLVIKIAPMGLLP